MTRAAFENTLQQADFQAFSDLMSASLNDEIPLS
jgi:hypothetical protein